MTEEQLYTLIDGLNDGGSAGMVADEVIKYSDLDMDIAFVKKALQKAIDGHHQTREFALAAMSVLNA